MILCSRLDLPGGIERAVVTTAGLLVSHGHRVTLLVLDDCSRSFYPVADGVSILTEPLDLGIGNRGNAVGKKLRLWRHVRCLRRRLLQLAPQVVLGTEYPFSIVAYAAVGKRVPVFAWEHHHFFHLQRSVFWQAAFRQVYPRLAGVICLNEEEKKLFESMGCRVVVIPNFVRRQEKRESQKKRLLTISWLTRLKGVDRIPTIAEAVFTRFPNWQWQVIGTGEEETWLAQKATENKLQGRLLLSPPSTNAVESLYGAASLYVMTSRMECFPMVLLEAQSFGLPAVAFDCPTGPGAIIRHGETGLLVPPGDTAAMAAAIISLIEDEEKRRRLGDEAHRHADHFSPAAVYALWQNLLLHLPQKL